MIVYKLFDLHKNGLGPLYVNRSDRYPMNEWIEAEMGPLADDKHVKSKLGNLSAKHPGFHCTKIPFTDWIGVKTNEGLVRRKNNVWVECEVKGNEVEPDWYHIPDGFYYFRTNSKQKDPWIIARYIKLLRVLSDEEVASVCRAHGIEPQRKEGEECCAAS